MIELIVENALRDNSLSNRSIPRTRRTAYSKSDCLQVLRLVANELQTLDLTSSKYHTWRQSRKHPTDYPTYRTIANHFGDWGTALVQAGLLEPTITELAERRLKRSLQALDRFANEHGFPTQPEWDDFARQKDLLRSRAIIDRTGKSWIDYRKQFDGKLNRPEKYSEIDCVRFVRFCAEDLNKSVSLLTFNDYKVWSLEHKEAPSIATLAARFGWKQIKTYATKRLSDSEQTTLPI